MCIFILFTFNFDLFAQQDSVVIAHLSTKDGLSNNQVHCIIQDSYGFLWIGTTDGLNRYDGYEFVVYRNKILDSTSLSSPSILSIVEGKNGDLWIGTYNGLNRYHRLSDTFVRYIQNQEDEFNFSDDYGIQALLIDQTDSNYIWIATGNNGLILFDIELNRFYNIKHDSTNSNSLSGNNVESLLQDSFGDFWIATRGAGLNRIKLNSIARTEDGKYDVTKLNSIKFEKYFNNSSDFLSSTIINIYEDKSLKLWFVFYDSQVLNYDRQSDEFKSSSYFRDNQDHFHEVIETSDGSMWFGSHGKVFRLNRISGKVKMFEFSKEGIRSSINQGLCEDIAGNIWIATWDGLLKLSSTNYEFERYYHNEENPSLPAAMSTYSILTDRSGKLWIGTSDGLLQMKKVKNNSVRFINYFDAHKVKRGEVYALAEDNFGSIWAVVDRTLMRINTHNNLILKYDNQPENLNSISFQEKANFMGRVNIFIDGENNLWVSALHGGISKVSLDELYSVVDLKDVTFTNYFNDPDDPSSGIRFFMNDKEGHLWLCTSSGGIINFDPKTGKIENYKKELSKPNSLSINYTTSVCEDKRGNIWIGTYGGGLNKLDRKTKTFKYFGTNEGLPSDIIQGILGDENGNLWICSNRGITKFNPESNKLRNFEIQQYDVCFKDKRTGGMYFANKRGFVVFHPDSMKESNYVPPVIFTKFIKYNDENDGDQIINRTISAFNKIELKYSDNIFSFEFAALGFNSNIKYYYSYQLEGLNKNWINIGNKREVTFTHLDPGDYTFNVKACNEDGFWCSNYTSIDICIAPPWWSTNWAYFGYGILFLSFLYGVRKFELNRRVEKEEKRILELENKRKTEELEEARHLQLSMLPKEIPSLPNLDIAVYMKTATEVGGDYYDFHKSDDNTLTTVIGDATGHGLNAGMLVSVTKGLFKNLANQTVINNIISQFNESIHSLNIQPMYMSLHLLQIKGDLMQVIGAGMPPILYYQNSTGSVVEIESSGPPLGGFINFKYEKCDYQLTPGDVIVIMTDGFAERRNNAKEILGWDKGKEILSRIKDQASNRIIAQFVEANDNWGEGNPQDDDITFVVIKVK